MSEKVPYIIAGPCSVESRSQLSEAVAALSAMPQVSMIRCGVWKPRTRPGGFEGWGEEALVWVRELREAVLVKNAPSPDVRLWIGALERCMQVGIKDVKAVHRGFDVFKNDKYRNNPLWEIPIELRRRMPEVPILCDPSHIAGRKKLLLMLAQTAMDLGFEGLMVESHPNPAEALTDAEQQVTPEELGEMLGQLVLRSTDSRKADEELRVLREQIDHLDRQTLQILAARFEVSKQIARVKAKDNLAVFQPKRWDSLLQQRMDTARELGLREEFVKEMYEKIHAESVRVQTEYTDSLKESNNQ